jgi:hypothetical protein
VPTIRWVDRVPSVSPPAAWRACPQQPLQLKLHRQAALPSRLQALLGAGIGVLSSGRRYGRVKRYKALDSFTPTKTVIVKL